MKRRHPPPQHRSINRWGHFWTFALVSSFLALSGRLIYIHAALSPQLLEYRNEQQRRTIRIPARRGLIVDTRGRLLAGSESSPSVYADPQLIHNIDEVCAALSPILGLPDAEIRQAIEKRKHTRFVWLARKITTASAEAVRSLELPGIAITYEPRRFYPHGTTLAHVLGFVDSEGQGLEGLELRYNETLSGQPGRYVATCDANRRPLWPELARIKEPKDGNHLVLTIDLVIQGFLEEAIQKAVEQFGADSGVGIVMSPQTGQVLGMACRPTFNLNHHRTFPNAAKRNRCLTDPVEPGSIFKPLMMAAALAEGLASLDERIDCGPGVWYFKIGKSRRRLRDTHPNGVLTAEEVIVKSSNIGMGRIGVRLGNQRLFEYVTRFGFGQLTGIDLPGEDKGIVLPLRRWNTYSTTSVPMGQELAVTPIQLVTAYSALATGGALHKPRIVRSVLSPAGEKITGFEDSEPHQQIVRPQIAHDMAQRVLVRMVNDSHHDIKLDHYQMLGKTGTAQVPYRDRLGYEPDAYLGSFIGVAPADDPQVAVLVMIRKPNKSLGYYGGKVAGPAVKEVLAQTLAYWDLPPDTKRFQTFAAAPPASRH